MTSSTGFSAYRLPPGRHGIPPEEVAEIQRWRLLGAAAEELEESGYVATTSTRVARRAGVSSATFYVHFENIAACLLTAFETAASCLLEVISEACDQEEKGWPGNLAASVEAALAFLASEPGLAKLLGHEPSAGNAEIAAARERLVGSLVQVLRQARDAGAPPTATDSDSYLIAAGLGLVADRIVERGLEKLPDLAPELTAIFTATRRR